MLGAIEGDAGIEIRADKRFLALFARDETHISPGVISKDKSRDGYDWRCCPMTSMETSLRRGPHRWSDEIR